MDHSNIIKSLILYFGGKSYLSDFTVKDHEPDDIKVIESNLLWVKIKSVKDSGAKDYSMGNPRGSFEVAMGVVTPQNQYEEMDHELLGSVVMQIQEDLTSERIPYFVGDWQSGRNMEVTACNAEVLNKREAKFELTLE